MKVSQQHQSQHSPLLLQLSRKNSSSPRQSGTHGAISGSPSCRLRHWQRTTLKHEVPAVCHVMRAGADAVAGHTCKVMPSREHGWLLQGAFQPAVVLNNVAQAHYHFSGLPAAAVSMGTTRICWLETQTPSQPHPGEACYSRKSCTLVAALRSGIRVYAFRDMQEAAAQPESVQVRVRRDSAEPSSGTPRPRDNTKLGSSHTAPIQVAAPSIRPMAPRYPMQTAIQRACSCAQSSCPKPQQPSCRHWEW